MNEYPINETHCIPEKPKHLGFFMCGEDYYHFVSKLSLEQQIERAKSFLAQTFCSGNFQDAPPAGDVDNDRLTASFFDEYQSIFNNLREGFSATSCEEDISETICFVFQSNDLKRHFSRAMTWALCADLLFKTGFRENAWSTLIEYKKCEFAVQLACEEENKLFISSRNRASGKQSYQDRQHLKNYLIELLESHAPSNGWRAAKNAATSLAPIVLERHMNSPHSSRFHPQVEEVEKWLLHWINTNQECKQKYKTFK